MLEPTAEVTAMSAASPCPLLVGWIPAATPDLLSSSF